MKHVKVAITGAAGQIGYALLFRIASGQMFGADTEISLHLLELEQALPALHGVIMELEDCAFPLLKNIVATADLNQGMKDVNWVLSVGAVPRKAGMERKDLLQINGGIFTKQGEAINRNAASDVRVFVVGNPCNTNCLIAMNHAPDVPKDRFYAMTMLDQLRAESQLAKKANVSVADVKKVIIWGNHSATQYPDYHHATIKGKPATQVITDKNWLENEFISIVQKRGAEVIKARGQSSAASAANAIVRTVQALTQNTPHDEYFSVAKCSQGEYDIEKNLIFSFPCQTINNETQVIKNLELNDFSKQKIALTLKELQEERDAVRQLGLLK